ncbi:hypothetical protein [Mycobacteroides abscessus]|uniref:hypothetical protein n=1 Tax=Mycobacteroides abscessus TaxID=36809 RepID=UPI001041E687|nr:hypothetical protein [Mycobacteroides abscessus]
MRANDESKWLERLHFRRLFGNWPWSKALAALAGALSVGLMLALLSASGGISGIVFGAAAAATAAAIASLGMAIISGVEYVSGKVQSGEVSSQSTPPDATYRNFTGAQFADAHKQSTSRTRQVLLSNRQWRPAAAALACLVSVAAMLALLAAAGGTSGLVFGGLTAVAAAAIAALGFGLVSVAEGSTVERRSRVARLAAQAIAAFAIDAALIAAAYWWALLVVHISHNFQNLKGFGLWAFLWIKYALIIGPASAATWYAGLDVFDVGKRIAGNGGNAETIQLNGLEHAPTRTFDFNWRPWASEYRLPIKLTVTPFVAAYFLRVAFLVAWTILLVTLPAIIAVLIVIAIAFGSSNNPSQPTTTPQPHCQPGQLCHAAQSPAAVGAIASTTTGVAVSDITRSIVPMSCVGAVAGRPTSL